MTIYREENRATSQLHITINRLGDHLKGDPQSGSWFVFRGKRGDRLKILVWDGDALWQKELEVGTFEFPKVIGKAAGVAISATELSLILGGVALNAKRRPRYTSPEKSSRR